MYKFGKIKVSTTLPEKLSGLRDISYNLWWSWNIEAIDLFREIDLPLWEKLNRNPVRFLQEVSVRKLEEKLSDADFMKRYEKVVNDFNNYMNQKDTWFQINYPDYKDEHIIYFSAEYGIHEVLPVYSGGLGVLSGDHCKTASDLGLPFTAIGLFYKQGYFEQRINSEGWQETHFTDLNYSQLPVSPVYDANGRPLTIYVELAGRVVYARIWCIKIGRVNLYLMDTDVPENNQYDRTLTERLYGGDRETRIQQEILLGIGGIRTLDALGIKGTVYHMNEGHSAFMALELARKLVMEKNMPFREAREIVYSSSVFTTHTPVPAGNDVFPLDMIDRYFSHYWGQLGLTRSEFISLGLKPGDSNVFNMAVLALNMSGKKNGVSKLHGAVSRSIYNPVWPDIPEDEVPITHVTNGIHTMTWLAPSFKYLFDKYLPSDWQNRLYDPAVWEAVDKIPDEEIWKTHNVLKAKMIRFITEKLKKQYLHNGYPLHEVNELDSQFDTNALTIGFARRFATYKRANLVFRNLARIEKILNNKNMPVQIIFAGKAHPADHPAHQIIKNIHDIARREGFRGKIFLLENYNMTVARHLVQGVDVWMNNPRRPLEASGTSGQKACINGVINFSVLDGWWCEGYNGMNGWVIGDDTPFENEQHQDDSDSKSLYDTLEREIIPLFYSRENGIPVGWVARMKESIKSLAPIYSTHRMVIEYTEKMYIPAIIRNIRIRETQYGFVRTLAEWKQLVERNWPHVSIMANQDIHGLVDHNIMSGQEYRLTVTVQLASLKPEDVRVEVFYGPLVQDNIVNGTAIEMKVVRQTDASTYFYEATICIIEGGEYGYSFRVLPNHPYLMNKFDLPLIKWADS
ncbi:MAG TPA: glycosyltransferase family 1 protein [Clostridiaceae bacterium]|nr:glycosyltransferase family 1 protein [Clostridiaceae bacterium]